VEKILHSVLGNYL